MTAMLIEKLEKILSGPEFPEHEFIISGCAYERVYAMAADIRDSLKPDDNVFCVFTESGELVAASVLAALATGAAMVLPYALSKTAMREIQKKAGFRTAVTDIPDMSPSGITPLIPREIESPEPLALSMNPDSVFLHFFTGGTTGDSVMWSKTPRNMFEEAFSQSRRFNISRNDRILATIPPYHIYGFLFSVLIPFVAQAGVVNAVCAFPQEIRAALEYHSPSVLVSIPMHYRSLRGGGVPAGSLRIAFSSAGKLNDADGDWFFEQTGAGVVEIYGSTETGGIAAQCRALGDTALTPFDSVDWKIMDNRLYIRSPFISPDIPKDPDGFFMTGDRAEMVDNARFRLAGRADAIVKVGGKRVDLEETGNKLKRVQGVQDVFVFAVNDVEGGRENEICALIQGTLDRETLMAAAARLMEPYALPRQVRIIEKIPVLSTGKYDRKAIKKMFRGCKRPDTGSFC